MRKIKSIFQKLGKHNIILIYLKPSKIATLEGAKLKINWNCSYTNMV